MKQKKGSNFVMRYSLHERLSISKTPNVVNVIKQLDKQMKVIFSFELTSNL
jgi:hypothetical protein